MRIFMCEGLFIHFRPYRSGVMGDTANSESRRAVQRLGARFVPKTCRDVFCDLRRRGRCNRPKQHWASRRASD